MFVPIGSGYAFNYDLNGGPGGDPELLIIPQVKVKLALNGKTGKDLIKFTGILELPKDFEVAGKILDIDFGGVTQSFGLDSRGNGKASKDRVSVKRKLLKGQFYGGAVRIQVSLKGTFSDDLVDEGLDNTTYPKPGVERFINVALILDGDGYLSQAEVLYKAKQNKIGTAIQRTVVR